MKLQAVMNRSVHKQGIDLLDIMRLTIDKVTGPTALLAPLTLRWLETSLSRPTYGLRRGISGHFSGSTVQAVVT